MSVTGDFSLNWNKTEPARIDRGDWPNCFAALLITHYLVKQRQGTDEAKGQ